MKQIPCYMDDNKNVLQFFPLKNVPGFTHRVVLNGIAIDWCNARQHSVKSIVTKNDAQFFFNKHAVGLGRGF